MRFVLKKQFTSQIFRKSSLETKFRQNHHLIVLHQSEKSFVGDCFAMQRVLNSWGNHGLSVLVLTP